MDWIKKMFKSRIVYMLSCAVLLAACSISYKFNGASIDYTKTKTIQISQFPIRSAYVWAPMQAIFNNQLTDVFSRQTKLKQVNRNGDLQISGEIVEYSQFNKAVSADGYSSQVQLKMTVNVRFVNNANHNEDFEQKFSATSLYDASQQLTAVQEDLVTQMVKDLVDQIFNATVANW
ncbi:MAG: LPS assembly lipoprotein LptE [Paraprevotella sp.]|nr:LPS assembly lipoprotein LptE [Paraprevotella sp.]